MITCILTLSLWLYIHRIALHRKSCQLGKKLKLKLNLPYFFSSYTLYFETLYYKGLNLENHLLNLTQTLESYHRKKLPGGFMDKEEYKKCIYKTLTENIPSYLGIDFKDSPLNNYSKFEKASAASAPIAAASSSFPWFV